jgi:hypothetical protein
MSASGKPAGDLAGGAAPSSPAGMPPLPAGGRPLSRFEDAPAWLFYIPVVLYWLYLSLRYRSFALPTLANPRIAYGGLCGESKTEVMALLGPEGRQRLAPCVTITVSDRAGTGAADAARGAAAMAEAGLSFPIVVKPDIGRRGTGVKLVGSAAQLADYLERFPRGGRVLLQRFVAEEGEAGVFYVRRPGEAAGTIVSLTLKYLPRVIGDGHSTLRQLILADPRAGRLSRLYLPRLARQLDRVLAEGEVFRLVFVGNHCRGAVFRSGQAYVTPALLEAFDRICAEMPGFNYGRFDVRFDRIEDLQRGEGFTILEINGAGSEATHIWDRDARLRDAYATLFLQVRLAFEIGAAHRRAGLKPMRGLELLRVYRAERRMLDSYPADGVEDAP